MTEGAVKSTALKRKLLLSHLSVAALGVAMLIIGTSATLWLRGHAVELATVSGPKTETVQRLQTGLQQSLANLRGWMTLRNTDFSESRRLVWKLEIYPSLKKLRSLTEDEPTRSELAKLHSQLNDLEMWQWHIEDVAQTPGNQPARATLELQLNSISERMFAAAAAMVEIEAKEDFENNWKDTLNALIGLRTYLYEADRALLSFVEHGRQFDKNAFRHKVQLVVRDLKIISNAQGLFSGQLLEQFDIFNDAFISYQQYATKVLLIRSSDEWNVAHHLLASMAVPLAKQIRTRLNAMAVHERSRALEVATLINQISKLIPWLMVTLLVSMIYLAYRRAKKGSSQFIGPVVELERQDQIKGDLAKLTHNLQGTQNFAELSEKIIWELAIQSGAHSGAFYTVQDERNLLKQASGYALPQNMIGRCIALGEGLVGQAWASNDVIEVVPEGEQDLIIQSSLLEITPKSLLIMPIVHEEKVVAVVELASLGRFTDYQKEYLDKSLQQIAVSLHAMQQNMVIQEALEESRAQSEELQSQQDELRATNEELNLKSEELQAQQEELRVTNQQLTEKGDMLETQAEDLEAAKAEAVTKAAEVEEASRYKSEFLANMSHELRTPLNSLLILAGSLAENDDGNLNEDEVESATVIHESGTNLLTLINDILDISKIEAGQMDVHNETLRLHELSSYFNRHFDHVAQEDGLSFSSDIAEDVPAETYTDSGKLSQVLSNLISNALKFTHQGGVKVNISTCSSEGILPGATTQLIAFAVSDTGVGIPQDKQQHIFQAFKQADGSTSRNYGGTGLGLFISANFARLLGGDIRLQSQEGEGSTFTLYIPHKESSDQAVISAEMPAITAPNPKLILEKPANKNTAPPFEDDRECLDDNKSLLLIIEDDPKFAKILFDACHQRGSQALVAPDGETGITLAKKHPIRGVILDMLLPGMDGREVLQHLKNLPGTANIPVHLLSAMDNLSDAKGLGAVDALTKPVTSKQIQGVLDKLMEDGLTDSTDVLVVEDDPASQKAMNKLLLGLGVNSRQATTPDEALQALSEQDFGLLILDLGLPGMNGCQLLKKIEADKELSVPHVIVYTGKELTDEDNECLQEFSDKVIMKSARSPERLTDEVSLFLHSLHQPHSTQKPSEENAIDFSGIKTLVVDDDMRNTFALSKVLRKRGMEALMAPSGEKALELLDQHDDIDIVLMDIMMPGMDGYETTAAIRSRSALQLLPVIALTAKAMPGDKEKCLAAGANDYLSKPIDTDKLFTMMQLWIRGKE
jgi:CheY-like chemotaxis protein/putative methionine-R-sulfoxide reductase with GAF domain